MKYRKNIKLVLLYMICTSSLQAQEPSTNDLPNAPFAIQDIELAHPVQMPNAVYGEDAWLHYDDSVYFTSVSYEPINTSFSWAVMFPSCSLQSYGNFTLTKVALFEMSWNHGNLILSVYYGNDQRPIEKMAEQGITMLQETGYHLIELECPVEIDTAQSLWIVFTETSNTEQYTASVSRNVVDPDPNARWVQIEKDRWVDTMDTDVMPVFQYFQWMIRGYITNDPLGTEVSLSYETIGVYPNPANDYLRLHYSPDVEPRQIELYDLQGRLVRSQGSGLESLNLQGLAPGQYVMKVTLTDGTSFSDKVVKE